MDMTVYVVQKQMKFDDKLGELVPRFTSIDKAAKYGAIEYLLSPGAHPFNPPLVLGSLHDRLRAFSDDDYLLLIGNPALIGMATAIAAHYNEGRVRFLQWSGRHSEYTEISARMF